MTKPRYFYIPADRVRADNFSLGSLSVRASDNREIGKLLGIVVNPAQRSVRSLVIESAETAREVPLGQMQLDAASCSLRVVAPSDQPWDEFESESLPQISEADLWVPMFTAA
jgi:hypothetical protein